MIHLVTFLIERISPKCQVLCFLRGPYVPSSLCAYPGLDFFRTSIKNNGAFQELLLFFGIIGDT